MKKVCFALKKFVLFALTVTMIFALAACDNANSNPGQEEDNQKQVTELTKITVSEPVRSELWGPVYLAKTLGYFEAEGLDVEFVTVQGDMPTAPVLSGNSQFGLYGPEMILKFKQQGQDVKLLLTVSDRYPYSFVTTKDITSIEQLKSQVVNGADSGSSPRAFVRSIVNSAGLNPDTDVTYVNINGAASIAALESGDIKGTYVSPTARAIALQSGYNLLVDIYDPKVHKQLLGSESYEMYIVFATEKYISENPEVAQGFSNAVYKALLWADSHSADEIVEAMKPLFTNSETLPTAIKEIKENDIWSVTGQFSDEGFAAINRVATASGLINSDVDRADVIAEDFMNNSHKNIK